MSEMKLPLTLEITSLAGCDAVISKELTSSIHPRSPWWAGSFKGCSGFQLVPCAVCVALCHGCCTWLWVKKYALLGVLVCVFCLLSIHRLPWWALSQHQIFFPPQASHYVLSFQSLSLVIPCLTPCIPPSFSCDLLHLCPPPLVFISVLLVRLVWFCFFPQLPIPHFPPAPGLCISFVLLAYPGPLILFLIPGSVQVCKVISAEEQTGFCSRKCWTIQGVGGAHSTTYNLEHCVYF